MRHPFPPPARSLTPDVATERILPRLAVVSTGRRRWRDSDFGQRTVWQRHDRSSRGRLTAGKASHGQWGSDAGSQGLHGYRSQMTSRNPIQVYADTTVYGGVFDEDYAEPSRRFFEEVRAGDFHLVVSPVVWDELKTPETVRRLFEDIRELVEIADVSEEAIQLQQAYLKAAIVGPNGGPMPSTRWYSDHRTLPALGKLEFQAHRELS